MEDFQAFKAWFSELMVEVSPLTAECPFSAYKDLQ